MLSAILVVVLMLCTLSACGSNKKIGSSEKNSQSTQVKHTGKKIKGEITDFSGYSDGVALVKLDNNDEKIYCIDKSGNIVFELDIKTPIDWVKFINGLAIIDGGVCDLEGKITYPEDVGAEEFFQYAFSGGYIIATKITADYSSSKKEMGILNTDFEWVIEPSETLFSEFEGDKELFANIANYESFYCNGVICFANSNKFLNVKTGEVIEKADVELPPNTWYRQDDTLSYYNRNNELKVDFSKYDNLTSIENHYINNKILIRFSNQEVGKYFWTIADEKGEFLFEPLEEPKTIYRNILEFDGENILIYNDEYLECYNCKGEKLGERDAESKIISISDGVISLKVGNTYSLYTPKFEPLF